MKVQAHNNKLETNVETESKSFGIGDASVVIEILRNRLYENKIQTLVQEYICNARDAMREVGKGNEFIVTMPTRLAPTFKVRDFGPGISPERMEKVFILYGASTKRGTNNQTGGFGIGAKSAWSYTDSFTVVTIVDGVRRTYVCHTGHNNQGSLDLATTDSTTEPNGTEIQIAVQREDLSEFTTAVYRAIYFWDKRPEVKGADGALPTLTPGYKVSDNIETIDRNAVPSFIGLDYYAKALAVIDGVPYPITEKLLNKAKKLNEFTETNLRKMAILHFGNGLVEVSASRESIADSSFTVDALNQMGLKGSMVVATHVTKEFGKVKSVSEWLGVYRELTPYFNVDKHSKFGDYSIDMGTIISENFKTMHMTKAHCLDKRGRYVVERITKDEMATDRSKNIPIDMLDQVFLVTKEETKIVQNKRLRAFFKGKPSHLSKVILLQYSGDPENVDKVVADLGVKVFESLEYTEEPKAERVKVAREDAEFCMHSFAGGRHKYTSLSKNTKQYLYVEIKDGNWEGFDQNELRELSWHLREQESIEIVGLADRAIKMVKGDKNFTPFKQWLDSFKPNQAQINFAIASKAKNGSDIEALIDLPGIQDEFLVEMSKEYKTLISGKRKIAEIPAMLVTKVQEASTAKDFMEKDERLAKLLEEKYPLVKEVGKYSRNRNELAFYINAKYTN